MRFRIYFKPFDDDGEYQEDWIEVTDDVDMNSLSDIRQVLDDDVYNVGVFKYSDFNIKMRNEHGAYSDINESRTIFKRKRAETLVRVTWQLQDFEPWPGVIYTEESYAGNDELEVFIGLLSDEAAEIDLRDQVVNFKVRGLESILSRETVPFDDIAPGDLVSDILYTSLNQPVITKVLDIDALTIDPTLDIPVDVIAMYENATVKTLVSDLLKISNSVFVMKDGKVHITSRAESAGLAATFYGQASNKGIENIIDLTDIRSGTAKIFNHITWSETSLVARVNDSVALYGVRETEFDFEQITNNTRRQLILNTFSMEFGNPKESFTILTPISEAMLAIQPLDSVKVDYPTVLYAQQGETVPVYGIAVYGEARYPFGAWSLTIADTARFKVMGRAVKTKNQQIEFLLRRI